MAAGQKRPSWRTHAARRHSLHRKVSAICAHDIVCYLREARRRRIAPSTTTNEIDVAIPPSQATHAESAIDSGGGPPLS